MKQSRQAKLTRVKTFASFGWPRYHATLKGGTVEQRKNRYRHVGGFYSMGEERTKENDLFAFYLESDFQPFNNNRYEFCDHVEPRIDHTGWFIDIHQDTKYRGIVVRLNNNRFMIGYTLGKGMLSIVDTSYTVDDAEVAALEADVMAQNAAELEVEYLENLEQ